MRSVFAFEYNQDFICLLISIDLHLDKLGETATAYWST